MSIETEAMVRIEKARARLILERRFYGVLVSNVEPVISRRFPTAATNGRQHFWNPDFVATLNDEELLFVQAHESEHDARHHGTRRESRDAVEWNIAGDYSINIDLVTEKLGTPPKGALIDPKYKGWSSEEIFRARELDKKLPPPPPEAPEADEDETEDDLENADTDEGSKPQDGDDSDDTEDGDEAGDAGEGDEQGDEGEGEGEGGDAESETEAEGGEGNGGSEPSESEGSDDTGSDAGDGKARPGPSGRGCAGRGEAGEAEGDGESEQSGSPDPASDPGGCGEVLDASGEQNQTAETDVDWDRIVRQAASMAKACGQLPGHVSREIERANSPPRDWRDELREFCEQGALRIETWNRPNRRFVGQGLTLPGTQRDGVNKAAFLIDTSGSMDHIALACVRDEAQQLLDDGIISEIVVVYGDTRVTRVDEYVTGDEIEFDPRGGGGTDMRPLFKHVADELSDVSLIINFTDLEIGDAGEEPAVPVMFAVYGYPDRVKRLMEHTPWGARAIDCGVH